MKLAISAGDLSGDFYGSHLVRELKRQQPHIKIFGMGGELLQNEGLSPIANLVPYSTVGFVEPLRYLFPILSAFRRMVRLLEVERPDALLLIDYQGFNMALARAAKKRGIRTVYFIAPQEWLWGTPQGVQSVVSTIDQIIAIFPKEYDAYKKAGGRVSYFGHPLAELLGEIPSRTEFCKSMGISPEKKIVSIFPGTRPHEVARHLPIALKVVEKLKSSFPDVEWVVATPDHSRALMAHSVFGFGKPGTVLTEALLLGLPYIAYYKLSPISAWIGRKILKIRLPFYTIPNLLAEKEIIPEFIQENATADMIAPHVSRWLTHPDLPARARLEYEAVRKYLVGERVMEKCAKIILADHPGFTLGEPLSGQSG